LPTGLVRQPEAGYDPYGGPFGKGSGVAPSLPTALFGNPATFTAAANTQANDYDKIMSQYDDLIKSSAQNPIAPGTVTASQVSAPQHVSATPVSFNPVTAKTSEYTQSGDVSNSLSKLSDLATTGGYSDADKADLRARGISPTRSIYANAQENVNRNKALSGGYSPNFGAVQAKMAREESDQISNIDTNVNAGIAQNVASNKLAAAPAYASASATANAARTEADRHNADIINQINEFNSSEGLQAGEFNSSSGLDAAKFNSSGDFSAASGNANRTDSANQFNVQAALDAAKANRGFSTSVLQGKTSLYGTTPALTNTFGNQVMQAGQLGQNQQQINNNRFGQIGNLARSV
jgi:hypothetical protein